MSNVLTYVYAEYCRDVYQLQNYAVEAISSEPSAARKS